MRRLEKHIKQEGVAAMKECECGCGRPAPVAKVSNRSMGWVKGRPLRFVHGHNAKTPFHDSYTMDDRGCWVWNRAADPYPVATHEGKKIGGHRLSYIMHRGQIPAGMHVHHLCREILCVNPDHLELREAREHWEGHWSIARRNAAKTHCKRGHPFDDENTYPLPKGGRECRTCKRMHAKGQLRNA